MRLIHLACAVGFIALAAVPVRADEITGTWCAPGGGKSIKVEDPIVISPGGKQVGANLTRHHLDFVIPPGEANAGATFSADQLSDEAIRVTIISKTGTSAPEIWTPCKPIS